MIKVDFENKLSKKGEFFWLRLAVMAVLAGRAYQHFFFRPPYTEIFWDEGLMKPFIDLLGLNWDVFLNGGFVTIFQYAAGSVLVAGLILLFLPKNLIVRSRFLLLLCGIILSFVALSLFKGNFYRVGQLFEYSAQVGCVFLLYHWLRPDGIVQKRFIWSVRILTALTFLCHGLYALGYYPVPYTFSMMVWGTFPFLSESATKQFLFFFGLMDVIAIVLILLPRWNKFYRAALWYCMLWGTITAFARVVGTYYAGMPLQSLHENVYEVIYRLPHAILPLYLLLYSKEKEKAS